MRTSLHDYRALRDEFVASDTLSIRGLAAAHGIKNHSPINDRAKKEGWLELRSARQAEANGAVQKAMVKDEEKRRIKAAKVVDDAFAVLEEAFAKMREDMKRTKPVRYRVGEEEYELREEPMYLMKPDDFVKLVDKMNALLGRPEMISESRHLGLDVTGALDGPDAVDILRAIATAARGRTDGGAVAGSPLPRLTEADEDPER